MEDYGGPGGGGHSKYWSNFYNNGMSAPTDTYTADFSTVTINGVNKIRVSYGYLLAGTGYDSKDGFNSASEKDGQATLDYYVTGTYLAGFDDGGMNTSETWYYVLKTKGYTTHAMAYNPQTNMMYEVNKNFGPGNMSKPYKWKMDKPDQAAAFWNFPGGRGKMLMAPVVVPRSEEATTWFETAVESGQWEYDGITCNCKTFVTMGLKDAGGAKFSELGPIPGIVGLSFTMYWEKGMASPAPYTPSHHGW